MTNFERTLVMFQEELNKRLTNGYRKIWVQGSNTNKNTSIIFTIFYDYNHVGPYGYKMEFLKVRNFRQYRPNASDQVVEMELFNRNIQSFRTILSDYINFDINE